MEKLKKSRFRNYILNLLIFSLFLFIFIDYKLAYSSSTPIPHKRHQILIISENDAYAHPYIDRHYTAGTSILYSTREFNLIDNNDNESSKHNLKAMKWMKYISLYPKNMVTSWNIGINSEIYTPDDKDVSKIPTEHPYAGILYLSTGITHRRDNTLERIRVDLGLTGPYSGAEFFQNGVHTTVNPSNNTVFDGWNTQISGEFVFNLHYEMIYRLRMLENKYFSIHLLPAAHLALGNGSTYLDISSRLKFGRNLNTDFGTSKVNYGPTSWELHSDDFTFYGFIGAGLRAVGRNIYIQGNSWESPRHTLIPFVYYGEAGIALAYKYFKISYTFTYKSEEFKEQLSKGGVLNGDIYGNISLSFAF